jgi:hypothetical protein
MWTHFIHRKTPLVLNNQKTEIDNMKILIKNSYFIPLSSLFFNISNITHKENYGLFIQIHNFILSN